MCVRVCVCVPVHVWLHICVYVCVCVCVYACTWVHICICVCLRWAHIYVWCACVCVCVYKGACLYVCTCVGKDDSASSQSHSTPLADTNHHQAESLWHSAWTYSCSFWFLTLFPILWWHNHWWWVQIRGRGHQHLSTDVHNLSGNSYFLAWSSGCCLQPWQKV